MSRESFQSPYSDRSSAGAAVVADFYNYLEVGFFRTAVVDLDLPDSRTITIPVMVWLSKHSQKGQVEEGLGCEERLRCAKGLRCEVLRCVKWLRGDDMFRCEEGLRCEKLRCNVMLCN